MIDFLNNFLFLVFFYGMVFVVPIWLLLRWRNSTKKQNRYGEKQRIYTQQRFGEKDKIAPIYDPFKPGTEAYFARKHEERRQAYFARKHEEMGESHPKVMKFRTSDGHSAETVLTKKGFEKADTEHNGYCEPNK